MFTKTYNGDTFKRLVRQYSNDRISRDPQYKAAVHAALAQKRKDAAATAAAASTQEAANGR